MKFAEIWHSWNVRIKDLQTKSWYIALLLLRRGLRGSELIVLGALSSSLYVLQSHYSCTAKSDIHLPKLKNKFQYFIPVVLNCWTIITMPTAISRCTCAYWYMILRITHCHYFSNRSTPLMVEIVKSEAYLLFFYNSSPLCWAQFSPDITSLLHHLVFIHDNFDRGAVHFQGIPTDTMWLTNWPQNPLSVCWEQCWWWRWKSHDVDEVGLAHLVDIAPQSSWWI